MMMWRTGFRMMGLAGVLLAGTAQAQLTPPEHLLCSTKADCLAVEGVCGGWVPVNQVSTQEVLEMIQERRTVVDCGTTAKTPYPTMECKQQRCVMVGR